MTAPRVSVLMPVYNGGDYLAAALDSILSQSLADLELVAVDDGSTDGSAGLLAGRAASDPRLVIVTNTHNFGLTHSLNKGLAVCRGVYIARQDADDLSAPGRLARQAEYLDTHADIGVLATAIAIVDAGGGVRRERYFEDKLTNAELQAGLLVDYCIGHGSVMMRRQALDAVGGYDAAMEPAEDHDLWLRLAEVTQLACLPEALYSYRHLGTSVSRTRRSQQVLRVAQAIENALRRRHGPAPSPTQLFLAACSYLRATIVAADQEALPEARARLAHALELHPALLEAYDPLAALLQDYTSPGSLEAGLRLYATLFGEVLPADSRLAHLRARLESRLHMREVFSGLTQGDRTRIRRHLWRGLRQDPRWLLNRGVLAIASRQLLGLNPGRPPA